MSAQEAAGFGWLVTELPKLLHGLADRVERMEQVQRAFQVDVRERLDRIDARLPPAILTRKQAAKLMKVSVRAIDHALDKGALREIRLEGSRGRLVDATSLPKSVNVAEELERLKKEVFAR